MRKTRSIAVAVSLVLASFIIPISASLQSGIIKDFPIMRGSGIVSDTIIATTQQDFLNGTMDHLDYSSSPGDLLLDKYTRTYYVGALESPDPYWYWTAGYTTVFADSRFILPVGGTITQITINVGDYSGVFRVKILRSAGSDTFYAVATSQDIGPPANQQSSYSVNLPCQAGDYLGIYVLEDLSALSWNGNNGNWYYHGEITNTPVTCTWSSDTVIATIQATLVNQSYYSEGNWTSPIYELNNTPLSGTVSWSADVPSGASLTVYARTSVDGTNWGSWQQVSNGGSVPNIQRYVQFWVNFKGTSTKTPILHDLTLQYTYNVDLTINEVSSYGSGNNEWVEIVNTGTDTIKISGLCVSDQDGNVYVVPDVIGDMPPNSYLIIYFGSGTDDYSFADGVATLYANFGYDVLNDDGDDILIYIGNTYIDYVGFGNGGPNSDIDPPPSGVSFTLNGYGFNGYAPCPSSGESISLIPNAVDGDEAKDWYITSGNSETPGGENVNALVVTGQDTSPQLMMQGDEDDILKINLEGIGKTGDFLATTEMKLSLGTEATDADVERISLYYDTNGNGYWDTSDTLVESQTFSGNSATFTSSLTINCGETKVYFLVLKISLTADINDWIEISVDGIMVAGNDVSFIPSAITTKTIDIVPVDTEPPQVKAVRFNPNPPVGPGTLKIEIEFDESMNTSAQLQVTYGPSGIEYDFNGNWVDDRNWSGTTEITKDMPSGSMVLKVGGGKDLVGNEMSEYTTQFEVDTTPPQVISIMFNKTPPLKVGNYTITITFSEDMNRSVPLTVAYGISKIREIQGDWTDSRTWVGTLIVDYDSENGNNTLVISDGEDMVGNKMEGYMMHFIIDTIKPTVKYFSADPQPILVEDMGIYPGNQVLNITVRFSEYVENVSIMFNDKKFTMFRLSSSEFYLQINTANLDEGIYILRITGAKDSAGNVMDDYEAMRFVVDKTPPAVEPLYPESTVEGTDVPIKISASDDYGISKVEIIYESEGIERTIIPKKSGNIYTARIPGNDVIPDKITVKVRVYDTVGNLKEVKFIIYVEPWWHALWWLWLLIILLIILLILFLFYRKRKEKERKIPMKESVVDKFMKKFRKEEGEYEEFYET